MRETNVSLAHCASCQFISEDLALITCPRCGAQLGEVTRRSGSWLPVIAHWILVVVALVIVAVAL